MNQLEQTLYEIHTGKKSVRIMPTINEIMETDADNYSGRKKRKVVKQAARTEKKAVRTDIKKARVENIRSKAKSRVILAEKGIVQSNLSGGIKDIISGAMGNNNPSNDEAPERVIKNKNVGVNTNIPDNSESAQDEQETPQGNKAQGPKADNKMFLYLGIAAAAYFLIMKK